MLYKGYNISINKDTIIIENVRDFDPVHTFECGQCFRWKAQEDASYTGVAFDRVINVSISEDKLKIKNTSVEDFKNIWFDYFDLGRDYAAIKGMVVKDEIMMHSVRHGHGIRILRQDFWEALLSFIISSNNGIPRIKKIIESLAQNYGKKLQYNNKEYYTFPAADKIAASTLEEIAVCRGGYRCSYISQTSKMYRDIKDMLMNLDTTEARNLLKQFSGVGDKVADCVLLFSGIKYDVFPTDKWVKRVMETLYFKKETSLKEIQGFAQNYFGEISGFAQQYLFYYARKNKIGI